MRYCGHFLIKAEGGAKNYERDPPLPLAWRPFTVVFLQRKGYCSSQTSIGAFCCHKQNRLLLKWLLHLKKKEQHKVL